MSDFPTLNLFSRLNERPMLFLSWFPTYSARNQAPSRLSLVLISLLVFDSSYGIALTETKIFSTHSSLRLGCLFGNICKEFQQPLLYACVVYTTYVGLEILHYMFYIILMGLHWHWFEPGSRRGRFHMLHRCFLQPQARRFGDGGKIVGCGGNIHGRQMIISHERCKPFDDADL
jgi:hypothetical protein